jgi:hypothetical protein
MAMTPGRGFADAFDATVPRQANILSLSVTYLPTPLCDFSS